MVDLKGPVRVAVWVVSRALRKSVGGVPTTLGLDWVEAVWRGWHSAVRSPEYRKRVRGRGLTGLRKALLCPPPGVRSSHLEWCNRRCCLFCWARRAGRAYAALAKVLRADRTLVPVRARQRVTRRRGRKPVWRTSALLRAVKVEAAEYVRLPSTRWCRWRQEAVAVCRPPASGRWPRAADPGPPTAFGLAVRVAAAYRYPLRWLRRPEHLAAARVYCRDHWRDAPWFTRRHPAAPPAPPPAYVPLPPADSRLSPPPVPAPEEVIRAAGDAVSHL